MKEELVSARQKKYIGVAALVEQAAQVLAAAGPIQERGTVREMPDERTVRYYLSEGLLSPAEDKQGTASVFGYLHLLQLLVVKKLQADGLPIRKIRELVDGRSTRQLERLLGGQEEAGRAQVEKSEALRYLESLLTNPARRASAPPSFPDAAAQLFSRVAPPAPNASHSRAGTGTWERLEVEPGLELHIRDDYRAPAEALGLRRLSELILRTIELHGRKPGKSEGE